MKRLTFVTTAAAALLVYGCGSNPLGPFQPEVSNQPDSFQLQATDVRGVSATLTYDWNQSGVVANVDHSTTTTAGQAGLVIRDAMGNQVYAHGLVPSFNDQTAAGSAGTWKIILTLTDYSGTLNFRVQAP